MDESKPTFQYSKEDFAKYDRINWEAIYKSMLKDHQLRKILKKNNYYVLNHTEINQVTKILDNIPFKDDLRVNYFTDHYQKNLSKFLGGDLTQEQLIYNLNFPRLTWKNPTSMVQSVTPPKIKRLNIKDIKVVLDRLNVMSHEKEKKIKDASSFLNNSISTTDMHNSTIQNNSYRMTLKPVKRMKNNDVNALEPAQLKYSIIKNMILEKFREREQKKIEKGSKHTTIKSKSQDSKLPKILHSIQAIEEEMIEKIDNKNLSSNNPRHHSFYLNYERKLSDGVLKSERKPLSYDSKEKPYKKMVEDIKARNIMDSNLKYHINKSADGYIEALQHFKDLSRSFNKNIVLKEINRLEGKRMSLGSIDKSKPNKTRLGLWDYLHQSNLIDQHKAGLISNIGISDMMMDKNQMKDTGVELKVKCERDLRDMTKNDKIYEKKKAIREGEFSRMANNMLKSNEIKMQPLKRYLEKYAGKTKNFEENIERDYDEGNDSLQSINENKLDCLYNESINLQRRLKVRTKSNFSEKIKRLIKLEELNNRIIEVNKRKLQS